MMNVNLLIYIKLFLERYLEKVNPLDFKTLLNLFTGRRVFNFYKTFSESTHYII